ncbi:hypothetical protein RUM43_013313 [Polyplax serrata]|uniref:Dendritic cell-specific transmembrane protein-like domain-containing protein n=1 Tax=Polyplax serrata TaxID=468196 RepID=A0AAN8Q2M0_POLSC
MAHFIRILRTHKLSKKLIEYEGIKLVSVPLDENEGRRWRQVEIENKYLGEIGVLKSFLGFIGRQAVMAYALFLAFTGPAKNTMLNMRTLSDSLDCGQEMVKGTLTQVTEIIETPLKSARGTFQRMERALKESTGIVHSFTMETKKIITGIASWVRLGANWMDNVVAQSNRIIGTPFQRCLRGFEDAVKECKAKMFVMDSMCHIVHVFRFLCHAVKGLDFMLRCNDGIAYDLIVSVHENLMLLSEAVMDSLRITLEFSSPCDIKRVDVKLVPSSSKTILQKISSKIEKLQSIFNVFGFMFGFLFLLVLFKVYDYKYRYMTSDSYDNIYLSNYIINLDKNRGRDGRETVMPLEPRETNKYGMPLTLRVLDSEKSRSTQSMFLLTLASFKIISFLICDYSLYWILLSTYEAGRSVFDNVQGSSVKLRVEGRGVLSDFYRHLGKIIQVPQNPSIRAPLHCLPDPAPPDTGCYLQIVFLLCLCWILTVAEPYGLRLRNVVMSHYYPKRARERAVWLYNKILRSRSSFLRFARRQLKRKYHIADCRSGGIFNGRKFGSIFVPQTCIEGKANCCTLCRAKVSSKEQLKQCKAPDCTGLYCYICFDKLENACSVNRHPMDYKEATDLSEEIDSSEDDCDRSEMTIKDSSKTKYYVENETFLTFKEGAVNRSEDNVRLGDVHCECTSDGNQLKAKLIDALKTRIRRLEREKKMRSLMKKSGDYEPVKKRLRKVIFRLKRNRSDSEITHKIPKCRSGVSSSRAKSHVSFELNNKNEETQDLGHLFKVKMELRNKVQLLKEKRNSSDRRRKPFRDGFSLKSRHV